MCVNNFMYPHERIFNKSNETFEHNYTDFINIKNNGMYTVKLNLCQLMFSHKRISPDANIIKTPQYPHIFDDLAPPQPLFFVNY